MVNEELEAKRSVA